VHGNSIEQTKRKSKGSLSLLIGPTGDLHVRKYRPTALPFHQRRERDETPGHIYFEEKGDKTRALSLPFCCATGNRLKTGWPTSKSQGGRGKKERKEECRAFSDRKERKGKRQIAL